MKVGQNQPNIPDSFYQTEEIVHKVESPKTEKAKASVVKEKPKEPFSEMTEILVPSQKTYGHTRKSELLIDGHVRASQLQSSLLDQAKEKAQEIGHKAKDGARNLKEAGEKLVESGELYRPVDVKDVEGIAKKAGADFEHKVKEVGDVKFDPAKQVDQMKDADKIPVTNKKQVTPSTPKKDASKSEVMIKLMKEHRMEDVSNPPTDAQLLDYYRKYAPAHELIAKGEYRKAAEEYKTRKNEEITKFSTYEKTEQKLNFVATMKDAGVKNLQFPPTQQNVKDYFKILGSKKNPSLSNEAILNNFQNYARTFYNHEGKDIPYREKDKSVGVETIKTKAPESWIEINDDRDLYSNGTRSIDCEGYTYLAKELLGAAGFKNGKFVVVGPKDNPNTSKDESTDAHVMFTAERNNEVGVVSNDLVFNGPRRERSKMLEQGYPKARGGLRAEDPVSWKASWKYEKLNPS